MPIRSNLGIACASILALGGFHIGVPPEDESIRIIHTAIDNGLTFMDNAWEYHDGESEELMGEALAGGLRQNWSNASKISSTPGVKDTNL